LFNRIWTTVVLSVLFVLAWGWSRKKCSLQNLLRADLALLRTWQTQALTGIHGLMFCLMAVIFAVRIGRGIIAPPLAWDALTYHLLKAGRWVQTGRWVWEQAPDAWQFYEYFSPLGDSWWAWTMLGTHTDAWLAIANGSIFLALLLAVYSFARELDFDSRISTLAAITCGSVPAVMNCITGSYVDNLCLMLVVAGCAFVMCGSSNRSTISIVFGTIAFALAVGVKMTFLPFLVIGLAATTWLTWSTRHWKPLLILLPAAAAALSWQIALISMGKTPFYPIPFSFFGQVIEHGHPVFTEFLFVGRHPEFSIWQVGSEAFTFIFGEGSSTDYIGYTWAFLVMACFAIRLGWIRIKTRRLNIRLKLFVLMLTGAVIIFLSFWVPSSENYRRIWLNNLARFSTIFYIFLVLILCWRENRFRLVLLGSVIVVNLTYCFPRAWTLLDYAATVQGVLFIWLAAVLILSFFKSARVTWRIVIIPLVCLWINAIGLDRHYFRFRFYEGTQVREYDLTRLRGDFLGADAAAYLDDLNGIVINYTAEYGGRAWWWYRYPFMGSRLQNQVLYIPATESGQIWNKLNNSDRPKMNYSAWTKRLVSKNVSYVFCTTVLPIEADWMHSHPERFRLEQSSPFGKWVLYKLIK
jgi:hypothetical protein